MILLYEYDAWGNCTITSGADDPIVVANPFRYRGYYYDTETGLYYCNARYYDPQIGRFIQSTDVSSLNPYSINSLNLATLNCLLLKLLIETVDGYSVPRKRETVEKRDLITVKKVLLYIRENYSQKITLDGIAAYALVDKYTLCKIFKKITDQTLFDNINAYRCMKAAEHISDGNSISEAALLCGFENNSYFTKTFKKHMGALPSKYKI